MDLLSNSVSALQHLEEPVAAVSLGVLLAVGVGCDGDAAVGGAWVMLAAGSSTPLGLSRRLVILAARSSMPLGLSWSFAACQRHRLCRSPAPLPRACASVCCARGSSRVPRPWIEACGRVFAHSSRASRAPVSVLLRCAVCITEICRWEWEGKGRDRERGKCPPQTPSRRG